MTIQELTAQQKDYVIETRRYLHAHPELGCEEVETTKFIQAELEKIGVKCRPSRILRAALARSGAQSPAKP